MPNHTHKSAAVPFVNQKGERSMKRVKVERYVAGKKPAYAKEDDEDEEYYTTDEEYNGEDGDESENKNEDSSDGDASDDEEDDDHKFKRKPATSTSLSRGFTATDPEDEIAVKHSRPGTPEEEEEEEDDDPRFRRLKQLDKNKQSSSVAQQASSSRGFPRLEERTIMVDEDEDEEEIRKRHELARKRKIEEPIGPQAILGEFKDNPLDDRLSDLSSAVEQRSRPGQEAEDILNDLNLAGYKPKHIRAKKEAKAEEDLKAMLEEAKQQAIIKAQLHKKIEEDNKKELEREALNKEGIGAVDLEAVKTDDEDEEVAYEEWKLREIKRVLRDRSERVLEAKAR